MERLKIGEEVPKLTSERDEGKELLYTVTSWMKSLYEETVIWSGNVSSLLIFHPDYTFHVPLITILKLFS